MLTWGNISDLSSLRKSAVQRMEVPVRSIAMPSYADWVAFVSGLGGVVARLLQILDPVEALCACAS